MTAEAARRSSPTHPETRATRRRAFRRRRRRVGQLGRVREPGIGRKWAFATSALERGARRVARETPLTRLARWGPTQGDYRGAPRSPRARRPLAPRGGDGARARQNFLIYILN